MKKGFAFLLFPPFSRMLLLGVAPAACGKQAPFCRPQLSFAGFALSLIPLTVRLRPEVVGASKRASLERRLSGDDTFTQQDLVEQALEPWLRWNGFLD